MARKPLANLLLFGITHVGLPACMGVVIQNAHGDGENKHEESRAPRNATPHYEYTQGGITYALIAITNGAGLANPPVDLVANTSDKAVGEYVKPKYGYFTRLRYECGYKLGGILGFIELAGLWYWAPGKFLVNTSTPTKVDDNVTWDPMLPGWSGDADVPWNNHLYATHWPNFGINGFEAIDGRGWGTRYGFTCDPQNSAYGSGDTAWASSSHSGDVRFVRLWLGGWSQAPSSGSVSGFGDPHLVNVRSEHFDVMQPGTHTFLMIPRNATSETAALQLAAFITARGDVCAGKMYISALELSGSWLGQLKRLRFSTWGEAFNTPEVTGLGVGSANNLTRDEFLAAVPPSMVNITHFQPSEDLALNHHVTTMTAKLLLGPGVTARIDWEHQKEKVGFSNWLKLTAWGLGKVNMSMGGLLGEDDHESVTRPPAECSAEQQGLMSQPVAGCDVSQQKQQQQWEKQQHQRQRPESFVYASASLDDGEGLAS